ncbi:MAG: signal recognition particle-docking protein FtsY [Candidatus Aminicenantales bacterium]
MAQGLRKNLSKTRKTFREKFKELFRSGKQREEILEELEETMILSDISLNSTEKIVQAIRERSTKTDTFGLIEKLLEEEIYHLLSLHPAEFCLGSGQSVVMMVGVNGGGKTTSLAKLAYYFKKRGQKILLVAADTFRAAAQEQLAIWGKKLKIPVIRGQYGADPASVVYDALQSFKARGLDLLLVDTAGRIHTNKNLMNELEKIKRVISREIEGAPQEILLVLDASTGQTAIIQAREFLKFSGITGIFLTKLDGTARGGSAVSIVDELGLPIKLLGTGESEKDMVFFSPLEFTKALLS